MPTGNVTTTHIDREARAYMLDPNAVTPFGFRLMVYVPRTIAETGGTSNRLGFRVRFVHSVKGIKL